MKTPKLGDPRECAAALHHSSEFGLHTLRVVGTCDPAIWARLDSLPSAGVTSITRTLMLGASARDSLR